MPAGNGRFGASGAVARPKVCANLEVYLPSERQWKPRLRQAAGTLHAMADRILTKSTVLGEIETIFSVFFFLIFAFATAKLQRQDL